jgi:hypothetical protein
MRRSPALLGKVFCWALALFVLAGFGSGLTGARAQEPGGPPKKAERPLPKHYDKLNLTEEQKKKVWATLDDYDGRIQKLQAAIRKLRGQPYSTSVILGYARTIKKLQAQLPEALEQILEEEQRQKLKELRGE